jgi:trehalose-phosphatase
VISKLPLEILSGKKNLEIRPRFLNKGEIVKKLLSAYPKTEFVFCAGDDKTDEDMFHSIASSSYSKVAYTCLVGDKKTMALNKVESPADTVKFLRSLVQTQTMVKV